MLFGILAWVIVGGIAGWLASVITGTHARQGYLVDILVGIAGGVVGGVILRLLGGIGITGLNLWSLLVATMGAVILLWVVKALRGAR